MKDFERPDLQLAVRSSCAMDIHNLIPTLYRQEYSKMVALLCSRFGIAQIDAAEDIVSETFLSASETWGMKGVPDNPVGWLYRVARNNALNWMKHDGVFRRTVSGEISRQSPQATDPQWDLSPEHITDSQLQMIFAVCHPSIPIEAQVSLALRVLCGFSIDEIAQALLTTKANINKRLYRAKEKLRTEHIDLDLPGPQAMHTRLDAVLITLYLLFNEGYYSASPDKVLRRDLCVEAMRLVYLLTEFRWPEGQVRPDIFALIALMCFQASRFDARVSAEGDLILYEQQDISLWDAGLIDRGNQYFVQACGPRDMSRFHLEAAIAWWHTQPFDSREKWENILLLYNRLLLLEYSPVAALNRAYAFARVYGNEPAITEAEALGLEGNLFYHSLLGELYSTVDPLKAKTQFELALSLAESNAEKAVISGKLQKFL